MYQIVTLVLMNEDFIRIKEEQNERPYHCHQITDFLKLNDQQFFQNVKFIDHLNNEVLDFMDFLEPSEKEIILRKFMVEKIQNIILNDLEKIKKDSSKKNDKEMQEKEQVENSIHCFGSYSTGLYLPGSDIDLTLITSEKDVLKKLQHTLANNPLIFSKSIIFLSKARIPILRFMDICHFRYDLSLNQENGIIQSNFIKTVLKRKPFIRGMVLFLKYFLKIRELNESKRGGLCSYAQLLMICNFVNLHPMIQRGIKHKSNLAVLFMDFFQYFGQDFAYEKAMICYKGYKIKENSNYISIEDPTDESHDVGSLCSNMNAIKDVFFHAFRIMCYVSKEKLGNRYIILPLWVKIGEFEFKWRENVDKFYQQIVVKNEI